MLPTDLLMLIKSDLHYIMSLKMTFLILVTLPLGILRESNRRRNGSDLDVMYSHYEGKPQISLWCDGKAIDNGLSDDEQPNPPKKRKKDKDLGHKFDEKESEVENIFFKLKEKHGTDYSGPQLKLGKNDHSKNS